MINILSIFIGLIILGLITLWCSLPLWHWPYGFVLFLIPVIGLVCFIIGDGIISIFLDHNDKV